MFQGHAGQTVCAYKIIGDVGPEAEVHDRDQDAETVLAALRMTSRTTAGFDSMGT
jgi:hypothetical protein